MIKPQTPMGSGERKELFPNAHYSHVLKCSRVQLSKNALSVPALFRSLSETVFRPCVMYRSGLEGCSMCSQVLQIKGVEMPGVPIASLHCIGPILHLPFKYAKRWSCIESLSQENLLHAVFPITMSLANLAADHAVPPGSAVLSWTALSEKATFQTAASLTFTWKGLVGKRPTRQRTFGCPLCLEFTQDET